MAVHWKKRRPRALALVVGLVASVLCVPMPFTPTPAAHAVGETIISTFYVPLFEDNAFDALDTVNTATAALLESTTSITVASYGTLVYYDEWEDGFEAAPSTPVQSSTKVFGDGNTGNGDADSYCVPAGRCSGDILPAGAVLRLNNSSPAGPDPGDLVTDRADASQNLISGRPTVFDGRDKIAATGGLAVTHATWPAAIDALHSEMASAYDTSRWGTAFVSPVGENTPRQNSDGADHFGYTGLEVMAKEAGTLVYIDANADGDTLDVPPGGNDRNGTSIGEGQTVYINGGIQQGATVTTSKPVQAYLMTGWRGSTYENRSYQLTPTDGLVNDYVAPASTAQGADNYATVLYIYNPQNTAITVDVRTGGVTTPYSVPAKSLLNPAPFLAQNQGARVSSTATFAALAANGTREGAGGSATCSTATQNSPCYDWGYSLVPARFLLTSLNVGWAPGSQDLSNATYDPVWVTTLADTTLYVDFDGDPTTGTGVDPNGARYDTTLNVSALVSTRITDTSDNDMTGARIYTLDGTGIAAAYGEDPAPAPEIFPGLDLGTTLFPTCGAMCVQKRATVAEDLDGDGQLDPGDTLQWTIIAENTGYYDITDAVLTDTLLAGVTYVAGTTTLDTGSGPVAVPDDVVPPASTLFPLDVGGLALGTIPVDGSVTIRFEVTVNNPYNGSPVGVCNRAVVVSDEANGADNACVPLDTLRLVKASNGNVPVQLGDTLTYTLTVSNTGTTPLTNVVVTDPLPAGLTWQTTTVTRLSRFADDFETANYAGTTGNLSWGGNWLETGDTGTPNYDNGDIQNDPDPLDGTNQALHFLTQPATGLAARRVFGDLNGYTAGTLTLRSRRLSLEADDIVQLQISKDGTTWTTLDTFTGGTDATFQAESYPLTLATHFGSSTQIRFYVSNGFDNNDDQFFADDVQLMLNGTTWVTAGSAAPNLTTLANLVGGESATVTVTTTATSAPTGGDYVNTATASSGRRVTRSTTVDCVLCFDYGDVPASYDTGNAGRARVQSAITYTSSTIADTFEAGTYAGSTGSVGWGGTWAETSDLTTTPIYSTGTMQNVTDSGDRALRFQNAGVNDAAARLVGDLSAYTGGVTLSFDRRCVSLEADDVVTLQISTTGIGGTYSFMDSWSNCNDGAYAPQSYLLNAATEVSNNVAIRFVVTTAFDDTGDNFYVDNVQLRGFAPTATTPGPRLGTVIDRESAAQSVATGQPPNGDDIATAPDDEDGVNIPAVDTNSLTFDVTVSNASGVVHLNGWFDWNNNGSFGSGESVFDTGTFVSATNGLTVVSGVGQVPGSGTYSVTIAVPDISAYFQLNDIIYSRVRVATVRSEITSANGASSDGEVQDYGTTLNTLPVNLSYVGSKRSGRTVTMDWRTAQEVDNLGFNVYAQDAAGRRTLLTSDIVLAKAPTSIVPQSYQVRVTTSAAVLWLEDIALDGTSTMHGPYSVGQRYGDPKPPPAINWRAARNVATRAATASRRVLVKEAAAASAQRRARPELTPRGPVARIEVTTSGIQYLTHDQLRAIGVDLTGVPVSAIALTDGNGAVPIEVIGGSTFGPGSAVRFYGQALDTLYTGSNVYRLHVDLTLARRISTDPAPPSTSAGITQYRHTTVVERNVGYSVSSPVDDPWYDRSLVTRAGRTRSASETVTIDNSVPGTAATAAVELWGVTRSDVVDEHHAELAVNGVVVAAGVFDDNQALRLEGTVPAGVLGDGANTLTVTLIGDRGVNVDIVAIDTWSLSYQRATQATSGRLEATVTGARLDIGGLPSGEVLAYRVGPDGVTRARTQRVGSTVRVAVAAGEQRYVVAAASAQHRPAVAPLRRPVNLLTGRADYLVVTHGMFTESLAPLLAYHRSLGRTVKVVDVADVYESYRHGVVDAAAIDAYLADAVPRLGARWVLLVGADTIDYRDYDGDGSFSLLPSVYLSTGFSVTHAPSDPAYADVDEDGIPDVALGRMPARTPAELSTMIAKSLAYAGRSDLQSVVLASDRADEVDFAAVNDRLAESFAGWSVRRADVDRGGVDPARAALLEALAEGVALTLFLGHSSSQEWSEVGLFSATMAADLPPVAAPGVVVQFGCWNTYYVSPAAETLGHQLMINDGGGAAVVMGATTLASAANDVLLAQALTDVLGGGGATLGDVVLVAKRQLAAEAANSVDDVLLGWTILGDPGLPSAP